MSGHPELERRLGTADAVVLGLGARVGAAVHPGHRVPHRAQLVVSAAALVLVLGVDLRGAIGFSSLAVLVYYAITNASALRLTAPERRWSPLVAGVGLVGCLVLALALPTASVVSGSLVLAVGALAWLLRRSRPSPRTS